METYVNCILCNATIPNCQLCQNSSACFTCYSGYTSSGSGCQCYFPSMVGCGNCIIPTECSVCNVGYFLNPTSKLCNLCTTLLQCTSCISYKRCTHCNSGYVSVYVASNDSSACQTCSSVIAKCVTCTNTFPSTVCLSCATDYGVTLPG